MHMTLAGGRGQGKRGLLAWSLAAAQSHQEPRTMAGITELALLELRGLEFCKPPPPTVSVGLWLQATPGVTVGLWHCWPLAEGSYPGKVALRSQQYLTHSGRGWVPWPGAGVRNQLRAQLGGMTAPSRPPPPPNQVTLPAFHRLPPAPF